MVEPQGADRLVGQTLSGYRLSRVIARGGMGVVYEGVQESLDRPVAVKVLYTHLNNEPMFVERFEREARAAARLRHPNIVRILDFGSDNGLLYMVMDLVDGESLRERLTRIHGEGLTLRTGNIMNVVQKVGGALAFAHQLGYVHRDVKPGNILLAKDGQIFLSDFGVVKIVGNNQLTVAGAIIGTPEYMSPEQSSGELDIGPAADQYALAVVAYEMLVGRAPFQAPTPVAVMRMQANDPPPPPSTLVPWFPPATESVLLRALAKAPAERFPDMQSFVNNLLAASAATPLPLTSGGLPTAAATAQPTQTSLAAPTSAATTGAPASLAGATASGTAATGAEPAFATAAPAASLGGTPPVVPPVATAGAGAVPPVGPTAQQLGPRPRNRLAIAAVLALVVALALVALAFARSRDSSDPTPTVGSGGAGGATATAPKATTATATVAAQQTVAVAGDVTPTTATVAATATTYSGAGPTATPAAPYATATEAVAATATAVPTPAGTPEILFSSHRGGVHDSEIYVMNPDGSNQRRITESRGHSWGPRFSPDGKHFVFSSVAPGEHTSHDAAGGGLNGTGNHDIYIANADGTNIVKLTFETSWDNAWSWSPDSQWITFTSDRDGNWELYKMDTAGQQVTRLTNEPAEDGWPSWTPDGKHIIYASNSAGNWEIYSMDPDGENVQRLTNRPDTYDTYPFVSPDGTEIVFSSQIEAANEGEIYVMNIDGSNERRLTNTVALNYAPSWSPDGSQIIFASDRDGNDNIYVMNADGSDQHALTNDPGEDTTPSWGYVDEAAP